MTENKNHMETFRKKVSFIFHFGFRIRESNYYINRDYLITDTLSHYINFFNPIFKK